MFKKLKESGWGLTILTVVYLWVIGIYFEYVPSREMMKEVQIVLTLGVLVCTIYLVKLIVNFIYNYLKEEK
jgi:hypothetical protein